MTDVYAELAHACGVDTTYGGPHGLVDVSRETIIAVLAAMGIDAPTEAAAADALREITERRRARLIPETFVTARAGHPVGARGPETWVVTEDGEHLGADDPLPMGLHTLNVRDGSRTEGAPLLAPPDRLDLPPALRDSRAWGLMLQLYALRSRGSWGLGDLHDLADLAAWSATELDAGFVLVNPLHATEPRTPLTPSPYLPVSRRFAGPLYLRVEDVVEYATLPPADRRRVDDAAIKARAASGTADLLDRDAAWTAKLAALETLWTAPRSALRDEEFRGFVRREGSALTDFATWNALAERHGPDIRTWPAELRDPRGDAVARARAELRDRVEFHKWVQWLCDEQLTAAQRAATGAGMPIGILHDLAVGAAGAGADAWMYRDVLAHGVTVGAPPDAFNQRGQDWAQPPWHPHRLAAAAYEPLRDLARYGLRHGGGLRVDHVMGLYRLWWIPEGAEPSEGTYVRYDAAATMGTLTLESARTGGVIVGEDLGTVEPGVREDLAARGVFGTSLLWFERHEAGRPRTPDEWRRDCLATVDSHDLPPLGQYLSGAHVPLRARLGLLTRDEAAEAADAHNEVEAWRWMLRELGLLPDDASGKAGERATVRALHAYLAATPARLLGVSLTDAVGERRSQNLPGTSESYPNWRVPLTDAEGRPVLLEDVMSDPGVRELAEIIRARL